jgi:hypothetical protein
MAVNKIRKISENRSEEKEEEFSMAVREKEESTIQVSESEFRRKMSKMNQVKRIYKGESIYKPVCARMKRLEIFCKRASLLRGC